MLGAGQEAKGKGRGGRLTRALFGSLSCHQPARRMFKIAQHVQEVMCSEDVTEAACPPTSSESCVISATTGAAEPSQHLIIAASKI